MPAPIANNSENSSERRTRYQPLVSAPRSTITARLICRSPWLMTRRRGLAFDARRWELWPFEFFWILSFDFPLVPLHVRSEFTSRSRLSAFFSSGFLFFLGRGLFPAVSYPRIHRLALLASGFVFSAPLDLILTRLSISLFDPSEIEGGAPFGTPCFNARFFLLIHFCSPRTVHLDSIAARISQNSLDRTFARIGDIRRVQADVPASFDVTSVHAAINNPVSFDFIAPCRSRGSNQSSGVRAVDDVAGDLGCAEVPAVRE